PTTAPARPYKRTIRIYCWVLVAKELPPLESSCRCRRVSAPIPLGAPTRPLGASWWGGPTGSASPVLERPGGLSGASGDGSPRRPGGASLVALPPPGRVVAVSGFLLHQPTTRPDRNCP